MYSGIKGPMVLLIVWWRANRGCVSLAGAVFNQVFTHHIGTRTSISNKQTPTDTTGRNETRRHKSLRMTLSAWSLNDFDNCTESPRRDSADFESSANRESLLSFII